MSNLPTPTDWHPDLAPMTARRGAVVHAVAIAGPWAEVREGRSLCCLVPAERLELLEVDDDRRACRICAVEVESYTERRTVRPPTREEIRAALLEIFAEARELKREVDELAAEIRGRS